MPAPEATGAGPAAPSADLPVPDGPPTVCSRCGGPLVAGSFVLPILGRAKFAYNLRGRSIETDVDALMCNDCGLLTFTAQDPQRIRRAHAADLLASAASDGTLRATSRGRTARGGS